ncbi:glycosyl hydrolase family 28-related protein [Arthrobacter ruber]|uniref:glycosyl hydrolase family 28-related protein n=1 Tax=Arthrobacter ruber TaxID=1258893 RepID=UPI00130010F3|nr:glycosyl hydrolase family 28-related protein [Arthrobacter ruber]
MRCTATGSTATTVRRVPAPAAGSSADSAPTIQGAIDAAHRRGGEVVQLSGGTYLLSRPLMLLDGVTLRGEGATSTRVKAGPQFLAETGPFGGHPLITTNGATGVTISDLTADHSGDTLDGNTTNRLDEYLIDVRYSRNAVVQRVTTVNPFTYSIAVVASTDFCILGNATSVATNGTYDQLDGIHILDSGFGVVQGNTVDQGTGTDGDDGLVAHSIGDPVHDVAYLDNTVRGGRHGSAMQIAVGEAGAYNLTIRNNRFWGSTSGLITGYYGGTGPVTGVEVRDNHFEDNSGPSVDFYGNLEGIVLSGNTASRSGAFTVVDGFGDRVDDQGNSY